MKPVKVANFFIGEGHPLCLVSGPCVIESEDLALYSAEYLTRLCERLAIPLIYKSSYDKANRLSHNSFRGLGHQEGLKILEKVKNTFNVPIITDIHTPEEAEAAAEVCDVLQIPAFLCRQTDLVLAAGATGRVIHLKKGQFMAPWDMTSIVEKLRSSGNDQIILVDRGSCFGYNNLVSDMRAIPLMRSLGCPVCFDASHSVQLPGGRGSSSGGQSEFIPVLARAAVAAGCDCLYIESHPQPKEAKSDKESQLPLTEMESLLIEVQAIHKILAKTYV